MKQDTSSSSLTTTTEAKIPQRSSVKRRVSPMRTITRMELVVLLLLTWMSQLCCLGVSAVRIQRQSSSTTTAATKSTRPRFRVAKKSKKSKGSKSESGIAGPDGDDDEETEQGVTVTDAPTSQPTMIPTVSPTMSVAPSESAAPSLSPSVSTAPSDSPTPDPTAAPTWVPSSFPSQGPTPEPSSQPSLQPTPSPSAAPSDTMAPTDFPYTTGTEGGGDGDGLASSASGRPSKVSSCKEPVPQTNVSPLVRQLVTYEVEIQIDRTQFGGSANLKASQVEDLVHERLAQALLRPCTYNGDNNPEMTRIDTYQRDTVKDIKRDDVCPMGLLCWVIEADFTVDMFYHLTDDEETVTRRRSLQQQQDNDEPALNEVLDDSTLISRLGNLLLDIYDTLDTDDGTVFMFRYFTNPAALENLGEGTLPDDNADRNGGVSAAESSPESIADNNNGVVAGFVLGCAALVLIAVTAMAIQRRRKAREYDKAVAQHFILDDNNDYDDNYNDEYGGGGDEAYNYMDKEMPSNNNNNKNKSAAAQDILADLQSLQDDQEEASSYANATTYSRKVYVLSDSSAASSFPGGGKGDQQILDASWTTPSNNRFGNEQTQDQAPVFVKTQQLKDSMKDLKITKKASFSSASRSYTAEDTVDL